MPRLSALVGIVLLAVLAWAVAPAMAAQGGIHWLDYDAALAAQKTQDKPMLIYFHLPYCYRCKEMKIKVYKQAAVIEKLNSEFIAAKVDVEKNPAPAKLYNSDYTPSYVFLSPAGKEVYRHKGVMGMESFLGMLDFVQSRAYRRQSLEKFMESR
ncbi:MAG: thioredoxin family protein [Desulfarculaceae bacterium]|nr:thioredoxin family protein [Desulfarculaceae bacterium]MCF8047745.1 thioredoxin family protein [Desulfarculaceae bacterium]MCF8064639.1 thioredoxin family protein [Desulfarculaceae bacterium]MCF8096326.1 thioredoxin family protein [Desulfarculaceae bacterium]MCF8123513.1 thioredoxin family protein [Desulfarculaceae bacterium]